MGSLGPLATIVLAMMAVSPPQQLASSATSPLWTITNSDCVSVHADGEPWDECGFQAFDMTADGSRVLTVSTGGVIQLWNDAGKQIARIAWQNADSGASGFPDGAALIVGTLGVVVVHHNQLLIIDLADGRIVAHRVTSAMVISDLRATGTGRVFAATRDSRWEHGTAEILLQTARLRPVPAIDEMVGDNRPATSGRMTAEVVGDVAIVRDVGGKVVARLPPAARSCVEPHPYWRDYCRVSRDGRKWLVSIAPPPPKGEESDRIDLALYAMPAG